MKKFILLFILFFCSFCVQKNSIAEGIFTNSLGMRFVIVYSGSFQMGSPETEAGRRWNEKQHKVTISKAFYMQETEVTQGQWEKLVGFNPSTAQNIRKDYPVDTISWDQCIEFIRVLNGYEKTNKFTLVYIFIKCIFDTKKE